MYLEREKMLLIKIWNTCFFELHGKQLYIRKMERKVILYIAQSLNAKIAQTNGSVDWLNDIPNPDKLDFGYTDFYNSVDTTIQGFSTYKQIIDWGIEFPYKGKLNFVFTRTQKENTEDVIFIAENHFEFVRDLKTKKGKNIWIIGGGKINTLLLNEKLIDEIIVFIMPIILSKGIELFELIPIETKMELLETEKYMNGVVKLKYKPT